MIDKEIILHIIDGPGTGLTFMVLGFFASILILIIARYIHQDERAFMRGKEAQRYDTNEQLKAAMAKLVYDQKQILLKLDKKETTDA